MKAALRSIAFDAACIFAVLGAFWLHEEKGWDVAAAVVLLYVTAVNARKYSQVLDGQR